MTDREKLEKVVKGLECCDGYCDDETGCPYDVLEPFECQEQLRADALALLKAQEQKCRECGEATSKAIYELQTKLKAQESIAPVKVNRYMETDENGDWFTPETYDCGNCGVELHGNANYCHLCGRAVKWG